MDRADAFYRRIGMYPVALKKEIDGYICDRLQEAMWREALHVLNKGIGTTEDIDRAIIYSAGLRWAIMGSFLHYHLAGGDGGMRHFIAQFDPTLELPWTDLPFPKWSDELADKLIDGCESQQGDEPVASWENRRNACLIDIMQVLKKHNMGVGEVLNGKVMMRRALTSPLPHQGGGLGRGVERQSQAREFAAPPLSPTLSPEGRGSFR